MAWCPGPQAVPASASVAASAEALWKGNNYHWSSEATAGGNFIKHLLIHNGIRILPDTIQPVKGESVHDFCLLGELWHSLWILCVKLVNDVNLLNKANYLLFKYNHIVLAK